MSVPESELRQRYREASDEDLLFLAGPDPSQSSAILREELARRGLPRPADAHAPAHVTAPTFSGRGSEYFRIWIVNVLLTLTTLGIYSAWAKVRKARYFRQNTWLGGHVFDYHGNPVAILRGRLLAAVLFAAYSWTFEFSNTAGVVTVVVLCVLGPALLMRAQQFALTNTSYRGIRFGFHTSISDTYRTLSPVVALWVAPALGVALTTHDVWFVGASTLALPWMHHRLKRYQRANAAYGDSRFSFTPTLGRFYWIYAKGLGLVLLGSMLFALALVVFHWQSDTTTTLMRASSRLEHWLYSALVGLIVYIVAQPYYAARLQQVVWSRTHLGDIRFRTEIEAWPLFGLVLKNVTLTVITAGLYWPFAAVALARYRIECIRVESEAPLSALAGGIQVSVTAAGEGAADAFGIDIGL